MDFMFYNSHGIVNVSYWDISNAIIHAGFATSNYYIAEPDWP